MFQDLSSEIRNGRILGAAGLYAAVSLACTRIPLLNYLGYEFSALFGLLASWTSGLLTIRAVRRRASDNPPAPGISTLRSSLEAHLVLLLLPLLIMSGNACFVKNCSMSQGIGFFLLIPVVSVVLASTFGFFCAQHFRHPAVAFILVVLLSIVYDVWLGYSTPAVYSYNFFYGYFPGITYDEALGITRTLILWRVLTLGVAAIVYWVSALSPTTGGEGDPSPGSLKNLARALLQGRRRYVSGGILILLVLTYLFRCDLGFEATGSYIRRELGASITTDHFAIYYSRASIPDSEIARVAAEHEFRLHQILEVFSLPRYGMIESYLYPSPAVKRRLTGAGITDIAKPWSGQIHLTVQSLDATLKHELVHVVAGVFGLPVIRANFSTGLVEGLATAIDWDEGTRTPHEYAAALETAGLAPDITGLMSFRGFASHASSVSYVLAGSFCRFLIDRFGMAKMTRLYGTGDYMDQYGRSLPDLVSEWSGFLRRIPVSDRDLDAVDALFRAPPIFGKVCPRVTAALNNEAARRFAEKRYPEAQALYERSYREGRGIPALGGMLASALHCGHYRTVVSAFDAAVAGNPHPAQYLPLYLVVGEAAWAEGDTGRAAELYRRLEDAGISYGYTEAASLRLLALTQSDHPSEFLRYFLSDAPDSLRISMVDSLASSPVGPATGTFSADRALADYLGATTLIRLKRYAEAINLLRSLRPANYDVRLEVFRERSIGLAQFRLGRFQEAKASFWVSLNAMATQAAMHYVDDWVDRCDWMSAHPVP